MRVQWEIAPDEDSHNSYPDTIKWFVDGDSAKVRIEQREITFKIEDIKKLVQLSGVFQSDEDKTE